MARRDSASFLHRRFALCTFPILLAICVAGMVAAADVIPDGTTDTTLDTTQNGITIVNIAVPNADGVSRNTYTGFNVDSQGLILNNADDGGVSQLGGAMLPNPGFEPGVGASVILNEVTNTSPSSLTGYTETFGRKASFVLANPNGITCIGCGFINTSRATLITGSEISPTGAVGAFAIGPGSIQIEGLGLNGANVDYIDIVSRVARIQAGISAGAGLAILTGNDQYDYAGKVVTSRAGVASPPVYAIDASVLGSMYAGTIQLIATESGVGVRTAGALSAQDRIDIESAGSVETASAEAGNDIRVRAATTFTQNGAYQAGRLIDLEADTFTLLDQIQSDRNLRLVQRQGDWTLGALNGGTGYTQIEAQNGSLTLAGAIYAGGRLSLTGQNINNQNQLAARGDLTLNASGDINNGDNNLIFAGQNMALNVDGTLTNSGQIYSLGTLSATSRSGGRMVALLNQGGRIESVGDMIIKAALLENTHNFTTNDAPTSFDQTDRPAVRIDDGVINGVSNWHEEFNPALKRGLIQTDGNLTIEAGIVNNNLADIFATGNINVLADELTNTSYFLREAVTESEERYALLFRACHILEVFGACLGGWHYHYGYKWFYWQTEQNSGSVVNSIIQAGGDLNIVATSEINNGTYRSGVSPGSNSGTGDPLAGLTLPGEGGLFTVNAAPSASHPYLIETNPDLIDLGALYGSNYFLDRVGYEQSEDMTLFLGDAWYDQQLIAEQVRNTAGQRYLYADAQSNNAQYRMLAEQAGVERARLGLQVGRALTDEQIALLDSSIIWYVEVEVQGYNVLAPRLYISTAMRSRLAQGYGAKISGRKVTLTAQNVLNEGVMVSATALTVIAAADLESMYGTFVAGSDINLAASDIRLTASTLEAGGNTTITAANDLVFAANTRTDTLAWTGYGSSYSRTTTTNDISTLNTGGDLRLVAGSDILIAGGQINAAGDATIDAGGALRVLAVQDSFSSRSEIEMNRGFWIFSEKETIVETAESTTSRAARLNIGGDLTTRSGSDTLVLGSELRVGGDLAMQTDGGDIKLLAGKSTDSSRYQRNRDGWIDEESQDRGYYRETLAATAITSGGSLSFTTGEADHVGDVIVAASSVSSRKGIRFGGQTVEAGHDLDDDDTRRIQNLRIESVGVQDQTWDRRHRALKGWAAAIAGVVSIVAGPIEVERTDNTEKNTTDQEGSDVSTRGDLAAHTRGDITIIGSDVQADGKGTLDAKGNVEILAAINKDTTRELHSETKVTGLSFNWDGSRASIGIDGKQTRSETDQTTLTHKGSSLSFGGNLNIRSDGSTTVAASDVSTDRDLNIDAKKGIAVVSAEDVLTRAEKQSDANLRVSVGVGNAYNDIYQATEAFKKAQDQTRVAQRSLKAFEAELRQMQADLTEGKVTEEDIRLRREDRKYYDANVALAMVNEASAAAAIGQSGARAAQAAGSSAGTGFYADFMVEMDGTTFDRTETSRQSVASRLMAGGNMNLNSGKDIHVQGSDLGANGNITLAAANDITIEAGRDTQTTREDRGSVSAQWSVSTAGTDKGIKDFKNIFGKGKSWNVAGSTGFDRSDSTTWRNSVVGAGDQLKLQSGNDTTLAGAQVQGRTVIADIGGNLTLESKQNTTNAAGQDAGLSIGSSRVGINGGNRSQRRRWTNDPTTLIGTESVNVNVEENTHLTGALLAQINTNGHDGGTLRLKTRRLTYRDLIDTDTSSDWSAGFSTGMRWDTPPKQKKGETKTKQDRENTKTRDGKTMKASEKGKDFPNSGTTSFQASLNGYVRGQSTRATLGQGIVSVGGGAEIPAGLNQDIDAYQVVTANRNTGGLDVDVTIDHRMLSKKGWKLIGKDFYDTYRHAKDIKEGIGQVVGDKTMSFKDYGRLVGDKQRQREATAQLVHNASARAGLNMATASAGDIRKALQVYIDTTAEGRELAKVAEVFVYDGDPDVIGRDTAGAKYSKNYSLGGFDRESGNIGINAWKLNVTNTDDKVYTIAHEGYHMVAQDYGYNKETENRLADSFGKSGRDVWNAYSWLGGYSTNVGSSNYNQSDWLKENRTSNYSSVAKYSTLRQGNEWVQGIDSSNVLPAELYDRDGNFIKEFNPTDRNVYVWPRTGSKLIDTGKTIDKFHTINATAYAESSFPRPYDEIVGIVWTMKNKGLGEGKGKTIYESATTPAWFYGYDPKNDGSLYTKYLQNYKYSVGPGGKARRTKAAVIGVLTNREPDPTGGAEYFEGIGYLDDPNSRFKKFYIDTGKVRFSTQIDGTRFYLPVQSQKKK